MTTPCTCDLAQFSYGTVIVERDEHCPEHGTPISLTGIFEGEDKAAPWSRDEFGTYSRSFTDSEIANILGRDHG